MVVSVNIRKVTDSVVVVKLDCGIEGRVDGTDVSDSMDLQPRQIFSVNQVVQAFVKLVNRQEFKAELSLRESDVRRQQRAKFDHMRDEWDDVQERKDKEELQDKNKETGRTQRVIKHPLFRPFSAVQAEEYLGSMARGDAVIRPSSKGPDHLAVTWKFADNVYQHIDVLELDKENEFSVGKKLKVWGSYMYSDLDELIVNHVKAMARKVDEMMQHEKFQTKSKADIGNTIPPKVLSCMHTNNFFFFFSQTSGSLLTPKQTLEDPCTHSASTRSILVISFCASKMARGHHVMHGRYGWCRKRSRCKRTSIRI
jgi:transcription elongation factor SPT6